MDERLGLTRVEWQWISLKAMVQQWGVLLSLKADLLALSIGIGLFSRLPCFTFWDSF